MDEFKKNLIIQIYGRNDYQTVNYVINEKLYRKKLVSEAWLEYLGEGDILILIPESLIVGEIKKTDEFNPLLQQFDIYYKEKIYNQVENKKIINNLFVNKIQSIGTYDNNNIKLIFDNSIVNIELYLFKDLLKIIKDYNRIIIDLSTGLNYYIAIILDVIRYLGVYLELSEFIKDEKKKREFILSIAPPVIQSQTVINRVELNYIAFFDLPDLKTFKIDFDESNNKLKEELYRGIESNFKNEKLKLNKILKETRIGFNALRYNTPLAFYDNIIDMNEIDNESIDIINENIFKILDYLENKIKTITINTDTIKIIRQKIKGNNIFNLIISLGVFDNIRKITLAQKEASLGDIESRFIKIYEKLPFKINSRFLERDIKEIGSLKKFSKNFKTLNELKFNGIKSSINHPLPSDIKRNFYAHSGFEYTVTEGKKVNGKIYLKYSEEKREEIRAWLENPS